MVPVRIASSRAARFGSPRVTSESVVRPVSALVCSDGVLLASGSTGGFDLQAPSAKPPITISISCATRIHLSLQTAQNEGYDRKNRAKFCHKACYRVR